MLVVTNGNEMVKKDEVPCLVMFFANYGMKNISRQKVRGG